MKNILITGATGFVGKELLKIFTENGYNVTAACRNFDKLPDNFRGDRVFYSFEDKTDYSELLKDKDTICHAASYATMWGNRVKEKRYFYEPSAEMIIKAKEYGIKKFILTSTIAANPKSSSPQNDHLPGKKYRYWPHLDYLIDLEELLKDISSSSFKGISLRLGHFIGRGNTLGLIPVLIPRLKTGLVPWIDRGENKVPLIGPKDIAQAFYRSAEADIKEPYTVFNITSGTHPSFKEIIIFLNRNFGFKKPLFSIPRWFAYMFASAAEIFGNATNTSPFISRAIVHLAENWETDNLYAIKELGYSPVDDWRSVLKDHVSHLIETGTSFSLKNNI